MALRLLAQAAGRLAVQQSCNGVQAAEPLGVFGAQRAQQTLHSLRLFSTGEGGSEDPADREARRQQVAARLMQGKSWRSWVEQKLDATIAEKQPDWAAAEEDAGAVGELLGTQAEQLGVPEEEAAPAAPAAAAAAATEAAQPIKIRRRGGQAEQEIFDIVFDRKAGGAGTGPVVPPGLPSRYSPLVNAKDAPQVVRGGAAKADSVSPARVHPYRLFYPGQLYSPQDLDPYKGREMERGEGVGGEAHPGRRAIPAQTVLAKADFRNPQFLSAFVTEGGRLRPRRITQLRQKLHRHLCRQVKVARILGLMSPDSKLPRSSSHKAQQQ